MTKVHCSETKAWTL